MPIYTRTGDDGTTSFFGGKRVSKSDPRVELYGALDELNSWLGFFKDQRLLKIQMDLCTIESFLAGWKGNLETVEPRIKEMEVWINEMDQKLPRLTHFILPGGTDRAAAMHVARAVCRRVERLAVKNHADALIIKYLNRLSDLLFTCARVINMQGKVRETVWSGIPKSKE